MAIPTNPELLKMPFAQDGDKNSIPETTGATTGLFSQQYGFQSINSLPLTAGGKAVSRLDWNGCMYMLSNLLYYLQRGYTFVYDDDMSYLQGCRVLDPNDGQVYNCIADAAAGTGAPSATPANWELAPSIDVLGYRKPDTAYAVGDIAFHQSLLAGYYLECTTEGMTSSSTLTISTPKIGALVTDGTVKWAINNVSPGLKDHNNVFRGAELPYTWEELQAKAQAGDFSNVYVGDFKEITLSTNEKVIMEVAGVDPYYNTADVDIGHHIDFISRDCLAGSKRMNATNTNNGTSAEKHPWLASELYQTLNNESTGIYAKLPSDLKSAIITKRALLEERYSSGGAVSADTGWAWANAGKLWLPTEVEVFGHHTWSEPGNGTGGGGCNLQYPIFYGGAKHIIKGDGNGGGRCAWWELSAHRTNATSFCRVGSLGTCDSTDASNTGLRAPLCFRIG